MADRAKPNSMASGASNKYRLEDLETLQTLGTGTFGRVVLARHRESKTYYALKILTISDIIRLKQVEHTRSEKAILAGVNHPFIVNLLMSDHDDTFLYMLLEYVCGGELFSYLRNSGRFNNSASQFYACEIVSVLDYLHGKSILYRDLKPENLLLDREGHLKITDFGFAKKVEDRTWTLCGTPEYLAPEIIQARGHNHAVDWWALGVLIYEMLAGYPPFSADNPLRIYEKIIDGRFDFPRHIEPSAKDLIKKLLTPDRTKRLGNMKNGSEDVKRHKWFKQINWEEVYHKKLKPPIVPKISHLGDTSCFIEFADDSLQKDPFDVYYDDDYDGEDYELDCWCNEDHEDGLCCHSNSKITSSHDHKLCNDVSEEDQDRKDDDHETKYSHNEASDGSGYVSEDEASTHGNTDDESNSDLHDNSHTEEDSDEESDSGEENNSE